MHISTNGLGLVFMAIIAGALVPLQAASNAELGRGLGHPLLATIISLVISLLFVIPVLITLEVSWPTMNDFRQLPLWAWCGGITGVVYITSALALVSKMGATQFIICVVAGQLITSLLIDHYGWMNLPSKEVNLGRIVGIALVLGGMLTVQWFTPSISSSSTMTTELQKEQ